ncbi:MAG TPA: dTDP-4-dehydrorhamnose 3,5-epimerase [Vicinamibacterales bacterium]|nr:dTDP-4-dehydrorhamnose 3,5-epimerase [Vicinamibacterales bacterium]
MRVIATDIPEVLVIEPEVYVDDRGFFFESYHAERYLKSGIKGAFVQDNHSRSVKNTVRGLHLQVGRPQAKLVRVLLGEIFDVAVDVRVGSPTFGQWVGVTLTAASFRQYYIPAGFAHGFSVLSDIAEIEYKCTDFYDPAGQLGLAWNDASLGIPWGVGTPILSDRDRANPTLQEAEARLPRYVPTET